MAHLMKIKASQVGRLIDHNNRDKEIERERSNKNIDKDLTKDNYNLMERDCKPQQYYDQRLSELHCLNRADVNTMCSWCVTMPEGLKEADKDVQREFFEHTKDFLNDRYGTENCVGAFVHQDEHTPHMHYEFIPVTEDRNPKHEEHEKVCAKEVVDRQELKEFHPDLQDYLREKMPEHEHEITMYNDDKERVKDLSLREYKAFREEERVSGLEREVGRKEIDITSREKDISERELGVKDRFEQTKEYDRYFDNVERYCEDLGLTEAQYQRDIFYADRGIGDYPYPEALNPERDEQQREEILEQNRDNIERDAPERDAPSMDKDAPEIGGDAPDLGLEMPDIEIPFPGM